MWVLYSDSQLKITLNQIQLNLCNLTHTRAISSNAARQII